VATETSPPKISDVGADFAAVARLLASPARAAMVEALLDGRSLSAHELAAVGSVRAPAASEHLAVLVKGQLVRVRPVGRHRLYELASKHVAIALEAFAQICPTTPVSSLRQASQAEALRSARTCYDHLAGRLGVALLDSFLERRWLVRAAAGYSVTTSGQRAFRSAGVDVNGLKSQRRAFARSCLDWTERRPHLGGALGAAVATALLDRDWIRRRSQGRGILITPAGNMGLSKTFRIEPLTDARSLVS
jgi:DNA-binding transcriptional ArsR family regulator